MMTYPVVLMATVIHFKEILRSSLDMQAHELQFPERFYMHVGQAHNTRDSRIEMNFSILTTLHTAM